MTGLDYFVIIIVIVSVVLGAARGFVKGVISVISVLVAFLAAAYLCLPVGHVLGSVFSSRILANLAAFALVFVAVILAGSVLAHSIRQALKVVRLSWADHLLGAVFGLLRGWLICSAIYLALTAFPLKIDAVEKAQLSPVLLEGSRIISYAGSGEVRKQFDEGYELVTKSWKYQEKRNVS